MRVPHRDDTTSTAPWRGCDTASSTVPRRALVLPGAGYTVDHPLLFWTCQALSAAGWYVQTVRWIVDGAAQADLERFVRHAADTAEAAAPSSDHTLVVGKSIGSHAAGWASERDYPGAWLTPLMTNPMVVEALRSHRAPALLVGGSNDQLWDGAAARRTGLEVVEIADADHSLHVGTDWRVSLRAHQAAVEAVERFAASVGSGSA